MKADIDATVVYGHPIDRVWAALSSSAALAAWLMPDDFHPEVGFTLTTAEAGQTRLRMHQVGFHGLSGQLTRRILVDGYPRILGQLLPAYLDTRAGTDTGPVSVSCAEGWRSYLGIVRRWRACRPASPRSNPIGGHAMAITSIEVMSVPVSDQERAKKFYADVLGFTVEIDSTFADRSMRWVMLRPPGGGSAITLVNWFDEMTPGWLRGTVLGCADIEQTVADLAERGVTFNEDTIAEAPWGRWMTFADPDGNGWVLQQTNRDFAG